MTQQEAVQYIKGYFLEHSHFNPRSPKVVEKIERRIANRLKDGFSAEELKRCVDFACFDDFYVTNGYYKQADVIFRSAERVNSILARIHTLQNRPIPL